MTNNRMMQTATLNPRSRRSLATNIKSHISPWLIRLVYPLGCYGVIPSFFGQIHISGQEHIPRQGPVIVAPTHRSRWDALLVPYAIGRLVSGRDLRFMVTANEIAGIQGWWIKRLGGFPVDVRNPKVESLTHSIELLRRGEMLVIFPEGGIVRQADVGEIKRGVAKIALEVLALEPDCGIKVLPVSIRYSQSVPTWGCQVRLSIAPPLNVADYQDLPSKPASKLLTEDLRSHLQTLHQSPNQI